MGNAVGLHFLLLLLCSSIPCLGRNILAIRVAVGGFGRDRNCSEYGGCSGDMFLIVIRQEFHAVDPPGISEMADGGFAIGKQIAAGHALRIRPRSDDGEKPVWHSPRSASRLYFVKITEMSHISTNPRQMPDIPLALWQMVRVWRISLCALIDFVIYAVELQGREGAGINS
jgi:hypothetical protein